MQSGGDTDREWFSSPASILAAHVLVFGGLTWLTWRKWPDPLVDFGRELYIPWQITRGKVLYRDIASLFGPLSPYVNALWMRVFGVSLMTIAMCNLAILAAVVAGIYRFIRLSTDRFTATTATLFALALCGFSQYVGVGNYNFVTPYSHEATHGLALSVVVLLIVQQAIARRRPVLSGVAGVLFGLLLLTKPEPAVAAASAVLAGWLGSAFLSRRDRLSLFAAVALFVAGAAVAPLGFFAYFRSHMIGTSAVRAVAAGWIAASNAAVLDSLFYKKGMGLDHPAINTLWMMLMFSAFLGFVCLGVKASQADPGESPQQAELKHYGRLALLIAAPLAQLLRLSRALPLVTLAAVVAVSVLFCRHRRNRDRAVRWLALMMWCSFALIMLAKILLNAGIAQYGFYLAFPAVTVVPIVLCRIVPNCLEEWAPKMSGRAFRRYASVVLMWSTLPHLAWSYQSYFTKTISIASGADRFYASSSPKLWQGAAVQQALQELERDAVEGDTVAVLPEGVMLNYLARRDSPLRVVNLMPPELLTFGELDVLHSLDAAPPAFVVLVHKDTSEYGYPLFGTDPRYGEKIVNWIRSRYRRVRVLGRSPETTSGFGIEILARPEPDRFRSLHPESSTGGG